MERQDEGASLAAGTARLSITHMVVSEFSDLTSLPPRTSLTHGELSPVMQADAVGSFLRPQLHLGLGRRHHLQAAAGA